MDFVNIARKVMRQWAQNAQEPEPLEEALGGRAIELWCDARGERLWLVADENDAVALGEPRGTVYTAAEARQVIRINDAAVVAEIHAWKRQFDGIIQDSSGPRQ